MAMNSESDLKALAFEIHAAKSALQSQCNEGHPLVSLKWDVLDSYVSNLLLLLSLRASGQSIASHPVVDRLIDCRVVLEKMKTLLKKQEPQISRLLAYGKSLQSGAEEDASSTEKEILRPRLLDADNIDSDFESLSESEEQESKSLSKTAKNKQKKVQFKASKEDEESEENDFDVDEEESEENDLDLDEEESEEINSDVDEEGSDETDSDMDKDEEGEEGSDETDSDMDKDDEDEEDGMTFEQKLASIRTDRIDDNEEIPSSGDESDKSDQQEAAKHSSKQSMMKKNKVYRPPKINPVYFKEDGDGKAGKEKLRSKNDKQMAEERFNRQLLQEEKLASLVEASEGPMEIRDVTPKELMERQRQQDTRKFEERNFIRIRSQPETKRRRNQMDDVMDLMEGRHDFPEASYMTKKKSTKKGAKRMNKQRHKKRR